VRENQHPGALPLPFGEQAEIDCKTDFAAVTVVPVRDGEAPYIAAPGRGDGQVQFEVRKEGNVVYVRLNRRDSFIPWGRHDQAVVLHVPRVLGGLISTSAGSIQAEDLGPCDLELSSNAGRVEVRRMTGRLRLRSDAGRIEAADLGPGEFELSSAAGRISVQGARGRLRLSSNAGRIDGERLAGSIEAESDLGTVRLGIVWLDPGEHRVRAQLGSVRVELARGLDARVEGHASLGSVRIQYPAHPNAAAVLRCTTDAGSIRVHEGDSPAEPPAAERSRPSPSADEAPSPAFTAPEPSTEPVADPTEPRATAGTETERILKLVEGGEISPADAEELLRALEQE